MPHFDAPDGLSLYYEVAGEGLPLLCLSGLTRNARDFDFVAPHLPGVRMIRMDYRGRGQSGWADPATYTVPTEAGDALALLDHLGIAKAAVLGTSRGGVIAMLLAAIAKDRLLGVCLNDIGPAVAPDGLHAIMTYLGRNPPQATFDEAAAFRQEALAASFPGVPLDRWRVEVTHTNVETPEGLKINYDPKLRDAVAAGFEDALNADAWPLFDAIAPLPCAVIHGENSDLLSRDTVEQMARRNPDLIVAHVPGRAHIPFLDEPESLAALTAWLERLQ
ncbi:alpha/beta fold hydrolase [Pseudooceanicola sp. 216_PA32_1]|uniref:Alpha/beta fold hydrolase n=1 Tax=Pseudooceanicola pacificus TaxID=2676438 RepID=A0A844W8Z5_9RHOB|nr:alpha/beta hydrolase [Pseudooceanicola pacificus]MWB79625.1 alpha/beta fold hydrolase [Pseudooceanicola pacificus]